MSPNKLIKLKKDIEQKQQIYENVHRDIQNVKTNVFFLNNIFKKKKKKAEKGIKSSL